MVIRYAISTDALNTVYESDLVAKFAQVLTQSKDYNSNAIAIRLDETLHNKFAMIAQDLGGIFVDNFNLFGTLCCFLLVIEVVLELIRLTIMILLMVCVNIVVIITKNSYLKSCLL